MYVRVKVLADDLLTAEDYKTGFWSFGFDSFDRIFFEKQPIYLPMVPMSTKKRKYDK